MSNRISKVNQVIKEELAKLIQKQFAPQMITVTDIETAIDLSSTKVWVSVFLADGKNIINQLTARRGYFRSYLGKKLFIKKSPYLNFYLDQSPKRVAKIEKLLKKTKV